MATCDNCDSHVTERYRRVFSSNNGVLNGCPNCRTDTEMFNGAGAKSSDG